MKKVLFFGVVALIAVIALAVIFLLRMKSPQTVKNISEITGFGRPFCLNKDKGELLYVCDFGPHQVKVYENDNKLLKTIGSAGKGDGQFNMPHSVDFDRAGNIVINDYGNKRVQKFTPEGKFISLLSHERIKGPATSFFDRDYNLYVSDFESGAILKFDEDMKFIGFIGMKSDGKVTDGWSKSGEVKRASEVGGFERVHVAKTDANGTIYVVDTWNNRIQRFNKDGQPTGWIGAKPDGSLTDGWTMEGVSASTDKPGGFSGPISLEIVGDELVILEYANPRVQRFRKKDGSFIGWFGGKKEGGVTSTWETKGLSREGAEKGAIKLAYDLKIVGNKMYIADTGNHRVQIIEFDKKF